MSDSLKGTFILSVMVLSMVILLYFICRKGPLLSISGVPQSVKYYQGGFMTSPTVQIRFKDGRSRVFYWSYSETIYLGKVNIITYSDDNVVQKVEIRN